jgi:hypothetical protein
MLYWEAKRGFELLKRFRQKVVDYDNNALWNDYDNDYAENQEAVSLRQQINEDMPEATTAIQKVGHSTIVYYSPPPATGGLQGDIDVLTNIFRLPYLGMDTTQLLDRLDQAIGAYRYAVSYLWRRLFNPFYWIGKGLALIGSIPFRVLRIAGFDAERAETSLTGKLVKAIMYFLTIIYSSLGILQMLDLLAPVVTAIKQLRDVF